MKRIAPKQTSSQERRSGVQFAARSGSVAPVELALCVAGEWMEAEALRLHLVRAAEEQSSLVLNFAELTHVEAACFQLLLAAERAGLLQKHKVRFVHLSDLVKRAFMYAGAESLICAEAEVA